MAPEWVAEFDQVTKVYKDPLDRHQTVRAVDGVTLRIAAGQVYALQGPNRAGKTTLVKLLLSLCHPTAGLVRRLGRPVTDRATLARVGFMHENQHFPRYLTATELLEYYGGLSLLAPAVVRRRVPELLTQVGLQDRAREPIHRFSKGMVQRLGLAQALLNDPDLLVLDEPTEGLDLVGRGLLQEVIAARKAQGKTVLLVSHVAPEVERVADRLAVILEGRLAFEGPLATLLRPADGPPRSLEQALQTLYLGKAAP